MSCDSSRISEADPAIPSQVTASRFRDAMARLGAAVSVVTTDGPSGRAGFTATAVCSVSDTPPTLLVCLNRSASVYGALRANGVLAVNVLAPEHRSLAALFGGRIPADERFAAAAWRRGETGSPLLPDAVASFDCRIADAVEAGTHTVLLCTVVGVACPGGRDALVYFERAFHVVPSPAAG